MLVLAQPSAVAAAVHVGILVGVGWAAGRESGIGGRVFRQTGGRCHLRAMAMAGARFADWYFAYNRELRCSAYI